MPDVGMNVRDSIVKQKRAHVDTYTVSDREPIEIFERNEET